VKVLELGCATGDFIGQLANQDGFDCVGSEISLQGLAFATKTFPAVKFIQLDATDPEIPYLDHFHLVGAFDVLEHIEKDTFAIGNVKKLLKKDGIFVITVPQYEFMWSRLDELVHHKRRYSKTEMLSKLIENGFRIEFSSSFVFLLFPFMLAARMAEKLLGKKTEKDDVVYKRNVEFPRWVNSIFGAISKVDIFLIRRGISLPFGGTLIVVARKG
jgi:SAM-dependent methyltransferase